MSGSYSPDDWARLMRDVDAAPSILNTKPWFFDLISGNRIELRPRWDRHLKVIDPRHRELFISCGAALFNLRLAIRVTGHDPVVWLLPGQTAGTAVCDHCGTRCGTGDLLASVETVLRRAHPATVTEQRLYEAIPQRHTVREPLRHSVRMNMVAEFERVARIEGANARLLHRQEAERVLRSVALRQSGKHPQLIALETPTDTPSDWIRAGQALQRLLLTATYYGAETSFLTQQLEARDRETGTCQLARQWWPGPIHTQMIIRVGGQ